MTTAEARAEVATRHPPFAINLPDLKAKVSDILSQVGRFGFFDEFTPHNIKHIDEMLRIVEWLIPPETKAIMTDADWFLIVCSCYLHDVGLLITRDEFNARENVEFQTFRDRLLLSGPGSEAHRAKLSSVASDVSERLLYQEFVRVNHGRRIRAWIEGSAAKFLGNDGVAINILKDVLNGLDDLVRTDLASICESHTLDDLRDFQKYPSDRAYGNDSQEYANVHFCAVILRTADLLQITSDRAPATLFKIINPADPISQTEWAKQKAVRTIRPQYQRNTENILDKLLPTDKIEVHAAFTDKDGYFGLTSYLKYAESELIISGRLTQEANQASGLNYQFPWRSIDSTRVEAQGFLHKQFEFQIDQSKILDLLTGHTIYNNGLVAVRELVQNSLDAVRLQEAMYKSGSGGPSSFVGQISITWDSEGRTLEIADNGTGMSQETIENHLLRVGSSKYRDQELRKKYPSFTPISRFGIGVLTAFMVADSVEIMTSVENDENVRQVLLRSVHGKYLISLLNKQSLIQQGQFPKHGTIFRLMLRQSIEAEHILKALRTWVVVPGCEVSFQVKGGQKEIIGHRSARDALESALQKFGILNSSSDDKVEVREAKDGGFELACAVRWSASFKEWELLSVGPQEVRPNMPSLTCSCVHGIAVEFGSPGFSAPTLVGIANSTGESAPYTNVARTMFEETRESAAFYKFIYEAYQQVVVSEVSRLRSEEHMSMTKSTNELPYLIRPISDASSPKDPIALQQALSQLKVCIVEGLSGDETRQLQTISEMTGLGSFWTVECEAVYSTETLLEQFESDTGVHRAIESLSGGKLVLPRPLLCNSGSLGIFQRDYFRLFEVSSIEAFSEKQQVNVCWTQRDNTKVIWDQQGSSVNASKTRRADYIVQALSRHRPSLRIGLNHTWLGLPAVQIKGLEGYGAVRLQRNVVLLPGEPVTEFLVGIANMADEDTQIASQIYTTIVAGLLHRRLASASVDDVERQLRQIDVEVVRVDPILKDEFLNSVSCSNLKLYDPLIWRTRALTFNNDNF